MSNFPRKKELENKFLCRVRSDSSTTFKCPSCDKRYTLIYLARLDGWRCHYCAIRRKQIINRHFSCTECEKDVPTFQYYFNEGKCSKCYNKEIRLVVVSSGLTCKDCNRKFKKLKNGKCRVCNRYGSKSLPLPPPNDDDDFEPDWNSGEDDDEYDDDYDPNEEQEERDALFH